MTTNSEGKLPTIDGIINYLLSSEFSQALNESNKLAKFYLNRRHHTLGWVDPGLYPSARLLIAHALGGLSKYENAQSIADTETSRIRLFGNVDGLIVHHITLATVLSHQEGRPPADAYDRYHTLIGKMATETRGHGPEGYNREWIYQLIDDEFGTRRPYDIIRMNLQGLIERLEEHKWLREEMSYGSSYSMPQGELPILTATQRYRDDAARGRAFRQLTRQKT